MARMWIGTTRRWGLRWGALLTGLLAITLAACGSGGVVPPTPTASPSTGPLGLAETPLATLGQLQARATQNYGQTGWVHIVETITHDLDRELFSTLPNGTPVPLAHVLETWAHLTGTPRVISQHIIYLRDLQGTILETSVYDGGVAWNSASGQRAAQPNAPAGAFDRRFGASVSEFLQVGAAVNQALVTRDNEDFIQIIVDYRFEAPSQYEDYTQAVAGQLIHADFDSNGGQLRRLDWVMRLADGSERNYGRWEIVLEAGVTPPDAVLAELEVLQ
jgi:hypothetical protein